MKILEGRLRWLLIFWMFLMSAIAYLDRVNISIAKHAIQTEYALSNVQIGWVFSAFVLGYALFQAPGGRLADRFGPRRIIVVGVLWWGVFTTATTLVPAGVSMALALLIGTRFVLGLGEAVVYPSSNRLVANWIPSAERGIANGLIFAGVGAGAGITPPLITYILITWGWRWSFIVSALLGLAAGAVWYVVARDTPQKHPWITPGELRHIESGLPEPPKQLDVRRSLPLSSIARSRSMVALSVSYFTYGYVAYIFFTWFFSYLNDVRGLDLKSSALYSMLPFMAMALASPLGGWIGDRLTMRHGKRAGRCGVAALGLALAAVFLALATQVKSAELASVVLAGGAGALYLSQSSFWAVTADIGGPSAGLVSGLMNMCNQIGGAITASLTPLIAVHLGWTASFLVAAILSGVGAAAWAFVDPDSRIAGRA
ncbi:MAG TPA: MFS transporter [Bryobacteraceae bacterium]|nr:MFS transporter [Bryobacteraceae bacterium]